MMIERDIRYKTAMMNLKSHCIAHTSGIHEPNDLFKRYDSRGSGHISRMEFVGALQKHKIMSIEEINTLANYYQKTYSNNVNYNQLVADLGQLKDTQHEASNVIVTDQIKNYCLKNNITLKSLFDEFSVEKRMAISNLDRLIKRTGLSNFNQTYLSSYVSTVDKNHKGYLTYFQMVGSFDSSFQSMELSKMLKDLKLDNLYHVLRSDLQKEGQTIANKFTFCKSTVTFAEELNKQPGIMKDSANMDVAGFSRIFAQVEDSISVDFFAVDTLEKAIGASIHAWLGQAEQVSAQMQKPDTSSKVLQVPGTDFSFDTLKRLKKYVANLDKMMKEMKTDYKTVFKKYDKKKNGGVSEEDFE